MKQEERRRKVLSLLAENPEQQRAYLTDAETDRNNVILTVAIRGEATGEILIPKITYDPFQLIAMIERAAKGDKKTKVDLRLISNNKDI